MSSTAWSQRIAHRFETINRCYRFITESEPKERYSTVSRSYWYQTIEREYKFTTRSRAYKFTTRESNTNAKL